MSPHRVVSDPINGYVVKRIGTNLVIRDGMIATRDGAPLAEYLAACGFQEGHAVNLLRHEMVLRLDTLAACAGIG